MVDHNGNQAWLIAALHRQLKLELGVVERIETHISTLLKSPKLTYKFKKPLDLGFLDFSTLEKRHHFCQEEVRLNGRLAPTIYKRVVAITGTVDCPVIGGDGEPFEYAVEMRTFDANGLLSQHPELITEALVDGLAQQLHQFHLSIDQVSPDADWGSPELVMAPMRENFSQIKAWFGDDSKILAKLDSLEKWTVEQYEILKPKLELRKQSGFIRECHGDLHLGNITLENETPLIFDGLEFNPELRWIDVASEVAFLLMDMDEHNCSRWGNIFINRYLTLSGDYELLKLLRFYQVYRSMVRAKVTAIRLSQLEPGGSEAHVLKEKFQGYIDLAESYTGVSVSGILIMHGPSGSGKSWYCENQLKGHPVIVVRSDIERKRLAGYSAESNSHSQAGAGIYTSDYGYRTYNRLLDCAEPITKAGMIAAIDATFLKQDQRQPFKEYAEKNKLGILVLDFQVPIETLKNRITKRLKHGGDPSEADHQVLDLQLETAESIQKNETLPTVVVTEQHQPHYNVLVGKLRHID